MNKYMIDELVSQAQQAEAEHKAAQAREQEEFVSRAEQALAIALGELWDLLRPHIQHSSRDGHCFKCRVDGDGLAGLELAPFWIHYTNLNHVYLHWSEYPSGSLAPLTQKNLAAFLAERRVQFHKTQQEQRDKRIRELSHSLRYYTITESDQAEAARQELIRLALEEADKWNYDHQRWQEQHQAALEQRAEMRRLDQLEAEYRVECARWLLDCQVVKAGNIAALDTLQSELDHTSQVWYLTYTLVATDDEGQTNADTDGVYVTSPEPDPDGWWLVYAHNVIARRRYSHPVSVEGPLVFRPTEDRQSIAGTFTTWNETETRVLKTFYFNPGHITLAEVEDMVNLILKPYPPQPPAPADLDLFRSDRALRNAIQDVKDGHETD